MDKSPKRAQTNTDHLNLGSIAARFSDEGEAYKLLERIRWADGVVCPHCAVVDEAVYLEPKNGGRKTRQGKVSARRVWKCKACKKQFSVTVGTVFERSHIQLNKWLFGVYLMCSGKNGVSAHELHRTLGITYKSAWFMCMRIREAMKREPLVSLLTGTVEMDETYVGGRRKRGGPKNVAPGFKKVPVVALVERESGEVRSQVMPNVTGKNIREVLAENVSRPAILNTDQAGHYARVGPRHVVRHEVVNHAEYEYARRTPRGMVTTNTVEGFFSQLKRSIDGTFHHVSEQHLDRYLHEFDLRYSTRKWSDSDRTMRVIRQAGGRRLTYREPTER